MGLVNSAANSIPAGPLFSRTASAGYSAIMGRDMATSQTRDVDLWPAARPVAFYCFVSRAMRQDLLGRLAMGSTHKTIYMPDIESIAVPIPTVE